MLSVKHHHEREDGRGYPDRLRGDQIPIGSKIIKLCDAVDAMLSDRPYRKALGLSEVRSQLTQHAGSQFDHRIAYVVATSTILEDHAAGMALHRDVMPPESYPMPSRREIRMLQGWGASDSNPDSGLNRPV